MRKIFILLLPTVLLSYSCKVFAQDTHNDSLSINEVVIQENRLQIPYKDQNRNISIIDQKTIRSLPVKSVNELLSYVSGVDMRQRGPWGSQADVGIDGGSFDQTLVLVNGAKVSDPQTGHNMMNLPIPLSAIERIEIIRGPAARIYGVNALAGVINIITKKPAQTGIEANVYTGSSFQKDDSTGKRYAGMGAEVFAGLAGKNINQQIGISHTRGSGYRYNTAFRNTKALYQNQIRVNDNISLNTSGGYVYNTYGANNFYAAPGDKESEETVQTALGSADADIRINNWWAMKPRLTYRYNKDDYIYIRQKPDVYHNVHETNVADAELNNSFNTRVGTLGLGLEWRSENINSNSLGKETRNNLGIFGEYHYEYKDKASLSLGAYLNYNSVYGWNIFPGLDLGWNFYPKWRLYGNIGTSQRLPTYTDLYYVGPSNIGNPDLEPEEMLQAEGGLRYLGDRLQLQLSYFYRHGTKFIDWVRSDTAQPWQPLNYSTLNTSGLTFSMDYIFTGNAGSNMDLRAGIGYTYLSPKLGTPLHDNGNNVLSQYTINSLKHQLDAHANLTLYKKFSITIAAKYNYRLNAEDITGYHLKSYFMMDSKLSYSIRQFNIYAEVNNLLNVQYIESGVVPLPGRWCTLGLQYKLWK
jgi:iron complex outermembrane receptor protein